MKKELILKVVALSGVGFMAADCVYNIFAKKQLRNELNKCKSIVELQVALSEVQTKAIQHLINENNQLEEQIKELKVSKK